MTPRCIKTGFFLLIMGEDKCTNVDLFFDGINVLVNRSVHNPHDDSYQYEGACTELEPYDDKYDRLIAPQINQSVVDYVKKYSYSLLDEMFIEKFSREV